MRRRLQVHHRLPLSSVTENGRPNTATRTLCCSSTLNLNNYIMTNDGGTGPASSSMCTKVYARSLHRPAHILAPASVSKCAECDRFPGHCAQVINPDGQSVPLVGDNQYHTYTIEWHTGNSSIGGNTSNSYVHFFVDGIYLGTNNAFVPTRGSRLWISLWPTEDPQCVVRVSFRRT